MKILTLFLSIWIVVQSTMPCCAEEKCDDSTMTTEQAGHNDDDCKNCSPLFTCGTCAIFVFHTASFSFQPVPLESKRIATPWTDSAIINWTVKIWQPPKLS